MYAHFIRKEYNLGKFFYFDPWPFGPPTLMIFDPEIAEQVIQKHSLDKHPALNDYLHPLLGYDNMVGLNGEEWKKMRSMFNPGFALNHLMTLVPGIVDKVLTFVDIVDEHAGKEDVFEMEELATRLTVDIIAKVVL